MKGKWERYSLWIILPTWLQKKEKDHCHVSIELPQAGRNVLEIILDFICDSFCVAWRVRIGNGTFMHLDWRTGDIVSG